MLVYGRNVAKELLENGTITQEQYDDLVRIGEVKENVEYNILEE